MKTFIATVLLSLSIIQWGSASEVSNKALKTVRELKSQVQSEIDVLKFYTLNFGVELNDELDAVQDEFRKKFDQEIRSTLQEIKNAATQKKGSSVKANECYEAAKSRFDSLNVTSNNEWEQCAVNKKDGVDPDEVLDSLLRLLSSGKKMAEYVDRLEKDIEKSSESELRSYEDKKLPAVATSLAFYDFSANTMMRQAGKAIDESTQQAKRCSNKHFTDVHVIALNVRENAFNCIRQA